LIVVDDTEGPSGREANLSVIQSEERSAVRYAGRQEKEKYIARLAQAGINPRTATHALMGIDIGKVCTTGANRNVALLDTLGQYVLSVDDDSVCMTAIHPAKTDMLCLGAHDIPRDAWFYATRECVMRNTAWTQDDLFAEHERLLGKSLSSLACHAFKGHISYEHSCDHLLWKAQYSDAKVRATLSGMVGDSGLDFFGLWFMRENTTRKILATNHDLFTRAFQSREILWVAQACTVTDFSFFNGTCFGIDNTALLPPFMPVGRKQDGVFGALLCLETSALIGHVPIAVLHAARPNRYYDEFSRFEFADLIVALLPRIQTLRGRSMKNILRYVGSEMCELARGPDIDLLDFISTAVSAGYGTMMQAYRSICQEPNPCPLFWKAKIEAYEAYVLSQLRHREFWIPQDLIGRCSHSDAVTLTRRLLEDIGLVLYEWPDIIDAAIDLQSKGIRMSRPV